jgi:transposase, IS6 family
MCHQLVPLPSVDRSLVAWNAMPITPTNPFEGRQFPGEVIILCVRWYLRYPLAYEHVAELLAERGVEVDPGCIWWVQVYAPN